MSTHLYKWLHCFINAAIEFSLINMNRALTHIFILTILAVAIPVASKENAKDVVDKAVAAEEARYSRIDFACSEAGWSTLRKDNEQHGETQIRVWFENGIGGITGYALSRTAARSSGQKAEVRSKVKVTNVQPRSGWVSFWARYAALGDLEQIRRLPYESYSHSLDSGDISIEWFSGDVAKYMSFSNDEADAQPDNVGVSAIRTLFETEFTKAPVP